MSTADEVKEHNEKVLRNVERIELVAKYMESIGCSDVQATTIAKAYAERFAYDGAVLSFQGKPVTQAKDDVLAHFRDNHLEFLLPQSGQAERPDVDPQLLASARAGNKTAEGQVFMALGKDRAALDKLLAEKPQANGDDKTADAAPEFRNKKNPWRAESWSITEQGRIIKTLGLAVAGRMAAAAQSRIGATKPSQAAS